MTSASISAVSGDDPYGRLIALGLDLPACPTPGGNYVPHRQHSELLFLAGQGPRTADGKPCVGKLGGDVSIATGYAHARLVGLNLLAVLHDALGDLRRVRQVVKVLGMVNATPDFEAHPAVIDGCSDLLVAVLGEAGRHARSAVGFGSLPGGITVEVEAIVAVS